MKIFKIIKAKRRLSQLKGYYRTGKYNGHPEEMLESIEIQERRIEQLRKKS